MAVFTARVSTLTGKLGTQIIFRKLGGSASSKGLFIYGVQYSITALAYAEHKYIKHDINLAMIYVNCDLN